MLQVILKYYAELEDVISSFSAVVTSPSIRNISSIGNFWYCSFIVATQSLSTIELYPLLKALFTVFSTQRFVTRSFSI